MPTTAADDVLVHVAVGVIVNAAREILVTRRAPGTHLAGLWEFPGGKVEAAESVEKALARELEEELGIEVLEARPLLQVRHRYPRKTVLLDTWRVLRYRGEPHGREGQPLRWLPVDQLTAASFPAADGPIIDYLCGRLLA
jgi:8-oxo-dGTP diphosphatase